MMRFKWNPNLYDSKHDYVYRFGEEIVSILNPQQDELILDLGCGTGELTKKIYDSCKKVIGLDNSIEMIQAAQAKYPEISFACSDAKNFRLDYRFDAVFSNAVLHWIPNAEEVIRNINRHLNMGGRFVAEFGGKGCVSKIITALTAAMDSKEMDHPEIEEVLYYPSIGKYSVLLERNGFELIYASLFDRPTELKGGPDGLKNFIEMFLNWLFQRVSESDKSEIIKTASDQLQPEMMKGETWVADYRRIRIVAVKNNELSV